MINLEPVQTGYKYDEPSFFASIAMMPKRPATWEGFKELCQQYISFPSLYGEIGKRDEKFHMVMIHEETNTEFAVKLLKIVSYITIILPLIALAVTALTYDSKEEVYFYKCDLKGRLNCFAIDAQHPEKLEYMQALHKFDPAVLELKIQ